jgi:hypothetical protein
MTGEKGKHETSQSFAPLYAPCPHKPTQSPSDLLFAKILPPEARFFAEKSETLQQFDFSQKNRNSAQI